MKMSAVAVALLIVVVGFLDWWTGYEASLGIFYLIPALLAGWRMGRRVGVCFALMAALASMIADHLSGHTYEQTAFFWWNGFNRFLVGAAAAVFAGTLRGRIAQQKKLIFDLRRALLSLSELSGEIPVCPACHRFRDDSKFRTEIMDFVAQQHDGRAFGQVCEECLNTRGALFPPLASGLSNKSLPAGEQR